MTKETPKQEKQSKEEKLLPIYQKKELESLDDTGVYKRLSPEDKKILAKVADQIEIANNFADEWTDMQPYLEELAECKNIIKLFAHVQGFLKKIEAVKRHHKIVGSQRADEVENRVRNYLYDLEMAYPNIIQELPKPQKTVVNSRENLKEIFVDGFAYNEAISALQEVDDPVIDTNMNYLLGSRHKSAITAWIEVLWSKGKIEHVKAPEMARLLNTEIHGLEASEKVARIPKNKIGRSSAHNKYFNRFNRSISTQ